MGGGADLEAEVKRQIEAYVGDTKFEIEAVLRTLQINDVSKDGGDLVDQVLSIRCEIDQLAGRVNMASVSIGGFTFSSFQEVQEWVRKHAPLGRYKYFPNALSLLEVIAGSEEHAFEEVMKTKELSVKGKFNSSTAAKVVTSYMLPMPSVFGRVPKLEGGQACSVLLEHPFPGIWSVDMWSNLRTLGGKKEMIGRAKETHAKGFERSVAFYFPGEVGKPAQRLAMALLTGSSKFLDKLCLWIDRTNEEMVNKYQLSKAEAWEMTSSCAVVVIAHVQEPRSVAREEMSVESCSDRCFLILWAALGAHRAQKELLEAQFQRHPCLAPVLVYATEGIIFTQS